MLVFNSNYILKAVNSNPFCLRWVTIFYFILNLYKFETLNILGLRNGQDIKKRKLVALTIENKLEACKMVKSKMPKFFIMELFSIGRSTLYDILKSEEKF